ncbi:hypothetical protein GXW82_06860 [Streptacidiphilus sp. 4-A2]|nr:hypothetical protein [Streptacidiphilus sp. 4-A2]
MSASSRPGPPQPRPSAPAAGQGPVWVRWPVARCAPPAPAVAEELPGLSRAADRLRAARGSAALSGATVALLVFTLASCGVLRQ